MSKAKFNSKYPNVFLLLVGVLANASYWPSVQANHHLISGVFNGGGQTLPCDVIIEKGSSLSNVVFECDAENRGLISNSTIKAGATVSGGKWTGYIHVETGATLRDFTFVGAMVTGGGMLGGQVINKSRVGGMFKDIALAAQTEIEGGILAGDIQADCDHIGQADRPRLENLRVKAGSQLPKCIQFDQTTVLFEETGIINTETPPQEETPTEEEQVPEEETPVEEETPALTEEVQRIQAILATSLHGTTAGMKYFYAEAQGGVEQFTHVPYEDLTCQSCHIDATTCTTCHEEVGDKPKDEKCLSCHSRQAAEQAFSPDHHITSKELGGLGFGCSDCHSSQQIHGDGETYNSLHENPNKVDCQQSGCHSEMQEAGKLMHEQHHDSHDCAACHAQTTPVCYNCHLSSPENTNIFEPPLADWKILVKRERDNKITTGNIMTITTAQGDSFSAVAPYFSHTISKRSSTTCTACHDSAAIKAYRENGTMTLVTWDDAEKTIKPHLAGVVPIPPDWETALQMDFLTRDEGGDWHALGESTPDAAHMLFAKPIKIEDIPSLE